MPEIKQITVGNTTFNVDSLKGITQKQALQNYHYLHRDVVKMAHVLCNPKRKTTKKI